MASSPYINQFVQPDTIIPNPANPQSWNRYSYVQNNPVRYNDPTGHVIKEDTGGGGGPTPPIDPEHDDGLNKDDNKRKPGEPRCKGNYCDDIEEILSGITMGLDVIGGGISFLEAIGATDAYLIAVEACIATEFVGCAPAFALALSADAAVTILFGAVENGAGGLSFRTTFLNDYLQGNTGVDDDIGLYVGKDTVVSGRNAIAGLIPEAYIDLAVNISQLKYNTDRASGNKDGGYVPVFGLNTNWQLLPLNKDFLKQIFTQDWW